MSVETESAVLEENQVTAAATPAVIKVPADYNGDGKPDTATWNPSDGLWQIQPSGGGATITRQFGQTGDLPVPGDYQDDTRVELGVLRPANQTLYVQPVAGGDVRLYPWATVKYRPVPADVPRVVALAKSCQQLAYQLHIEFRMPEAVVPAGYSRDLYRKLAEMDPVHLPNWAAAAQFLGSNLALSGQAAEGVIATYEAVEICHQLGNRAQLANSYVALAGAFHQGGRFSEAVTPSRRARDLYVELVKTDPALASAQIDATVLLSSNLALCTRYDEAIAFGHEAVDLATRLGNQPKLAAVYGYLADRYHLATRFAEAAEWCLKSRDLYRSLSATDPAQRPGWALAALHLSGNYALSGQREPAVAAAIDAADVYRLIGDRPKLAVADTNLVEQLQAAGRPADALNAAKEAWEIYTSLYANDQVTYKPGLAKAAYHYAQILAPLAGRKAEAKHHAGEALTLFKQLRDENAAYQPSVNAAQALYDSL